MSDSFDVIIVGGGAAGLTAALYAARRGLSTLVLTQDIGGQAATTSTVENYPGIDLADGLTLMMTFKAQAEKYGAQVRLEEVTTIGKTDQGFTVTTHRTTYHSLAVVLAQGLTHKHLDVPGEQQFIGHGVSYCATCDAPLFKGKPVAVIGGGNSAMDAALLLTKFSPQVTIVTTHDEFRGERVLIDRLQAAPEITAITKGKTLEVLGAATVTGVVLDVDGQRTTVDAQGVFVEIGYTVNPKLMTGLVALDKRNQVVIDPLTNGTDVPGLFAAGDVTTISQKQIVISAGEGAKAALSVDRYLQSLGVKPVTGPTDWGDTAPRHHEQPNAAARLRPLT